jgi:hypothetical protein
VWLFFWLACRPAPPLATEHPTSTPPTTPAPTHPAPTTPTTPTTPPSPTSPPLQATAVRPDPNVYLYWQLEVDDAAPGPLDVHLLGGDGSERWLRSEPPVPLAFLHADTTYELTVTDAEGRSSTTSFTTEPLPAPFPVIEALTTPDIPIEPGLLLLPVSHPEHGLLVLLDEGLQPVWVAAKDNPWYAVEFTGQAFAGVRGSTVKTVTLDGVWRSLNTDETLHHDVRALPDGDWLTLGESLVQVDAYPLGTDACDQLQPATLLDTPVLQLDADGVEVARLSMLDVLQPTRCAWNGFELDAGGLDWAHLNSVQPVGDDVIVSSRTQSAVVRVGLDGQRRWILSNPDGWQAPWSDVLLQPDGPVVWPAKQHSPHYDEATGLLTMFDNGGKRYSPYAEPPDDEPEPSSRVVAYQIDEEALTVSEAWDWAPDPPLYAGIMGDADRLDDGYVLSTWTWLHEHEGIPNAERGWGDRSVRIIEFEPGHPQPRLDLLIRSDRDELPMGWWVFRAERLAREALLPGVEQPQP